VIRDRLLDRFVLEPDRRPLPCEGLVRETFSWRRGMIEAFILKIDQGESEQHPQRAELWTVLKYPGTSGRAESIGPQPFPFWPGAFGSVVGINPPGYGRSTGKARLRDGRQIVDACHHFLMTRFMPSIHVVSGNSLGGVRALDHVTRYSMDGLLLRNPPPLPELIENIAAERHWRGIGRWLARGLPKGWDAAEAAEKVTVPTLWITSEQDRLVPCPVQRRVFDRIQAPKRHLVVPGIEHHEPIPDFFLPELREAYDWFRSAVQLERAKRDQG